MRWTHETVYVALVNRQNNERVLQSERYAALYPQNPFSAVLYAPGGRYDAAPLSLNEARESFRTDVFKRIALSIKFMTRDNRVQARRRRTGTTTLFETGDALPKRWILNLRQRSSKVTNWC
jgi:hypothetical protein